MQSKSFYPLLLILIFFSFGLSGQNIKKGFKNLEKGEIESAKIIFDELIKENNKSVIANFGLALVYSSSDYRGVDYILAFSYINATEGFFNNISSEEKIEISDYITNEIIKQKQKSVDEKLFLFIQSKNSLDITEEYLRECRSSEHYKKVVDIRNSIEFHIAKEYNSISVYENFIKKYPKSKEALLVKALISEMVFNEVQAKNSISEY